MVPGVYVTNNVEAIQYLLLTDKGKRHNCKELQPSLNKNGEVE
jgi:hypothetical protein